MNSLVTQAKKASADPRECCKTLRALQAMGFGDDAFMRLHHQKKRTAAEFYNYSEGRKRFEDDGNNHRVHQRLRYIQLSCSAGTPPKGKSFQTLAEEAYEQIRPTMNRAGTFQLDQNRKT